MMGTESKITNPYTGLRPFEEAYSSFFFGRDLQVQELYQKLNKKKFVAVLGYSGSGKSSLVKCGLIPKLTSDLNRKWKKVECRPGSSPVVNLANALTAKEVGLFDDSDGMDSFIHSLLQRSSKGLEEAVEYSNLGADEHLLILIDQFEELFRFRKYEVQQEASGAESMRFVNLLVNAINGLDQRIHLVITMRSEFLGDCANFQGFPDAINQGQYLIPPMTRTELKEVITKPVLAINRLNGTEISLSRALIERVLNDLGSDQDQLPILQHTLQRTWQKWVESQEEGLIGLTHYSGAGGMKNSLNNHADNAYGLLKQAWKQRICQKIFRAITEKDADGIETRRPERLSNLAKITQMDERSILEVVDVFTENGSFLQTYEYHGEKEESDLIIDISHESLMRKWDQLRKWVIEESEAAAFYHKLAVSAKAEKDEEGDLLTKNSLIQAKSWWKGISPNREWAQRYDELHKEFIKFSGVESYLNHSEKIEKRKIADAKVKEKRRARGKRVVFAAVTLAAVFFSALSGYALYKKIELEKKEIELSEKNGMLEDEKEIVDAQAVELIARNLSLKKTTKSLEEEKANLEISQVNLRSAITSLTSTKELLQKSDTALRDTISELHLQRRALADTIVELEKTDSLLDDKIEDLEVAHTREISRSRSLSALNFLELGDREAALDSVVCIEPDTNSARKYTNENYQAFEAVWSDQADEDRTIYSDAPIVALDIKKDLIVFAENTGEVVVGTIHEVDGKFQIVEKQRKNGLKGKEDQMVQIEIASDLQSIFFTTLTGSIYSSEKKGDEFEKIIRLGEGPATRNRLLALNTKRNLFFSASTGLLEKGDLSNIDRRETIKKISGETVNFLDAGEDYVVAATANQLILIRPETGKEIRHNIPHHSSSQISAVRIVKGKLLILGYERGEVSILKIESETVQEIIVAETPVVIDTHASAITGLDFRMLSDSNVQIASSGYDKKATLFEVDIRTLQVIEKLDLSGHKGWIYGISYFDLSEFVVTYSEDKTIHFWPISASQARDGLKRITTHKDWNDE